MEKEFEALRNLERVSKNSEIIIQHVIGVYMGGGVQVFPHKTNIYNEYKNDFETIKQALTTKSKKEQAFDIIVKKQVDYKLVMAFPDYNTYKWKINRMLVGTVNWGNDKQLECLKLLTEEEFNLIREVLKND